HQPWMVSRDRDRFSQPVLAGNLPHFSPHKPVDQAGCPASLLGLHSLDAGHVTPPRGLRRQNVAAIVVPNDAIWNRRLSKWRSTAVSVLPCTDFRRRSLGPAAPGAWKCASEDGGHCNRLLIVRRSDRSGGSQRRLRCRSESDIGGQNGRI